MLILTSVVPLFTFGLFQLSSAEGFTQCYYPDGSIPTDYVWEPCTGAKYSSCCVPSEGDICQADGLCYYPDNNLSYRGTCTDRTWNDPSCNANICVTGKQNLFRTFDSPASSNNIPLAGFETTWTWALQCDGPGGSDTFVCGAVDADGYHESTLNLTCPSNEAAQTTFMTTTSTTTAGRYTPPPSVDTKIYSVFTSQYTETITANAQTTTLTSTYASTFTSKIAAAAASATGTNSGIPVAIASGSTASDSKGAVTLSVGALVGIIVAVIALLTVGLITAVILRNKHMKKKEEQIRLNTASPPPPNGPVGRDQVYPYEAPANEVNDVEKLKRQHGYVGPKVDTYEIDDHGVYGRGGEKTAAFGAGRAGEAEMRGQEGEVLRSPAPEYSVAVMPVELDASPSVHAPSRGENRDYTGYGRY